MPKTGGECNTGKRPNCIRETNLRMACGAIAFANRPGGRHLGGAQRGSGRLRIFQAKTVVRTL